MFDSLNFFKKKKTSQLGVELDHLSNLYLNPLSSQKIKKAVNFADQAHQGQFRKSGEPFIIHPINVGMILASLKMDADTIIAGLLHDVVEDCDISLSEVRKEFGKNVSKKQCAFCIINSCLCIYRGYGKTFRWKRMVSTLSTR